MKVLPFYLKWTNVTNECVPFINDYTLSYFHFKIRMKIESRTLRTKKWWKIRTCAIPAVNRFESFDLFLKKKSTNSELNIPVQFSKKVYRMQRVIFISIEMYFHARKYFTITFITRIRCDSSCDRYTLDGKKIHQNWRCHQHYSNNAMKTLNLKTYFQEIVIKDSSVLYFHHNTEFTETSFVKIKSCVKSLRKTKQFKNIFPSIVINSVTTKKKKHTDI